VSLLKSVADFFNAPQDILDAFQPYYQTAELADGPILI
jgi:type I restriction enzyme R subunit